MLTRLFRHCAYLGRSLARALRHRLRAATKPAEQGVVAGAFADLVRGRPTLVAENAFLCQQLLVRRRSVKRPRCTPTDRALLMLLASRLRAWRQALLIVQPETLLRWHRQGFPFCWRGQSRPRSAPQPKVAAETIALIRELAAANRLWGAERIRGELLNLGIRVAKTTVQRHMRAARPPRRAGQSWATFLRNHAPDIWACDFLPVTTPCSGPCTPSSWSRSGRAGWCMSA
jgi:putative transposase